MIARVSAASLDHAILEMGDPGRGDGPDLLEPKVGAAQAVEQPLAGLEQQRYARVVSDGSVCRQRSRMICSRS